VQPVELFVAYGVANVLAVLPVVPAGLGIIEATSVSLLVGFGVPAALATFGVLGWRLVNFWLPIPLGAAAYVSLRLPFGNVFPGRRRPSPGRLRAHPSGRRGGKPGEEPSDPDPRPPSPAPWRTDTARPHRTEGELR
jgi:hypothetical protein